MTRRMALAASAMVVLLPLAGCSNPIVESITGVDVVQSYSSEQEASYRAALTLAVRGAMGSAWVEPTPSEWQEMYQSAATVCEGLATNGRTWLRDKMIDELLKDSPGSRERAGQLSDVFINAATAQGSFCPEQG